jgi:hypothetical protein
MKKNFRNKMFRNGTIILATAMSLMFGGKQTFAQCSPPAPISGTPALCPPSYTTTLTDATAGGTWSTGDDGVLTVDASTGVVTGLSGGIQIVTYTVPGGCFVTIGVTNGAITGPSTLCYAGSGDHITLSDAFGGGTWSSSNTYLAVVPSGDVTAGSLYTGTLASATISYTLAGVCTGTTATKVIAIDPTPTVNALVPSSTSYCELDNIYFTTTITSGTAPYTYWWEWDNSGSRSTFASISGVNSYTAIGAQGGGVTLSQAGTYFTHVVDSRGCTSLDYTGPTTITVNPRPTPYTLSIDPSCSSACHSPGATLQLSSTQTGVTYFYGIAGNPSFEGHFLGTGSAALFTISSATAPPSGEDYLVMGLYVPTGCGWQMSPQVHICNGCAKPADNNSMSNTSAEGQLTLSPNPNNGNFIISGAADFMLAAKTARTEIMDITGRMVLSQDAPVDNGSIRQAMELPTDIAGGLYFVKVSTDAGSQVLRVSLSR